MCAMKFIKWKLLSTIDYYDDVGIFVIALCIIWFYIRDYYTNNNHNHNNKGVEQMFILFKF